MEKRFRLGIVFSVILLFMIININLSFAEVVEDEFGREYSGYIIEFEDDSILERKSEVDEVALENENYIDNAFILNPIALYKRIFSIREGDVDRIVKDYSKDLDIKNDKIKENVLKEGFVSMNEFKNVFNGISLNISDNEAEEIKQIPGVKRVYKNLKVKPLLDSSVSYLGVDEYWDKNIHGGDCDGEDCLDGSGVSVAIIDTGLSYDHPDFGECNDAEFLAGNCERVKGGYDFVNDDAIPEDKYDGHGTHVAGIVGADGVMKGVAPGVDFYAYKVLTMAGGELDHLVAGINRAMDPNNDGDFSDRIDIISMSLGTDCNGVYNLDCGPEDAISSAVLDAINAGSIVVVSAGNDGPEPGTITSPAVLDEIISVGAHYNNDNAGVNSNLVVVGSGRNIVSFPLTKVTSEELNGEVVNVGEGESEDYVGKNVEGKIVLISINKGELFFSKIYEAEKNEAIGVIFYRTSMNEIERHYVGQHIPSVFIGKDDGLFLASRTNDVVKINIENSPNAVAYFSSRGPVNYDGDSYSKPDILAPGVSITSSNALWLLGGSYPNWEYHVSWSGTSMAAPHVSGVIALIKQMNPDITHKEVKELLMGNAKEISGVDVNSQGAGMINFEGLIKFKENSRVINSGNSLSGNLIIRLEKFESNNWLIQDSFSQQIVVEENFDLREFWNSEDIGADEPGLYRVQVIFVTERGIASSDYEFIVE
ncbi:S8 family serine peptidase [archaeon]|jgi:subtilisin family serine protease|nr:S8 family serine peptidase [archaeon]MBT4241977.1 S8 family serine peptidase [archaeon]MBT4418524.1 S8 family serine peptidase [archaeon]